MSLAQQVQGIVDNLLERRDEVAVVSEILYPPPPRFDYKSAGASAEFVACWQKMDRTSCNDPPNARLLRLPLLS
jgi:hypothetical protein